MKDKNVSGERSGVSGAVTGSNRRVIAAFAPTLFCLLTLPLTAYRSPLTALQIQDNSFLIEEAYNQERGVVQHISNFIRPSGGDSWAYNFTQEWPLGGIRHQLSYSVPVQHDADGTGLGDVGVNYRYQLIGNPAASVVFAPRLSFFLPTGDHEAGRGFGGVSFQTNLPLTLVLAPQAGDVTGTPASRSPLRLRASPAARPPRRASIWAPAPSGCCIRRSI